MLFASWFDSAHHDVMGDLTVSCEAVTVSCEAVTVSCEAVTVSGGAVTLSGVEG